MDVSRSILAGTLIDGSGQALSHRVVLQVKAGRITAIDPVADSVGPDDPRFDNLSRCILLPPLVDCSVRLTRSPSVDARVRQTVEEADQQTKTATLIRHLGYCRAHGVLGLAANDVPVALVTNLRGRTAPWPTVAIGREAGPSFEGDFLRLHHTGSIEEPDGFAARQGPADLRCLLGLRGRKKAVVVANGSGPVAEALAAGCDAIEQGYLMGEDNLRRMADRGVLWIPSVLRAKNGLDGLGGGDAVACRFSQRYVAPGPKLPGQEAFWWRMLGGQLDQLRLARAMGVVAAVGTGAGNIGILHGEAVVEELKLFIKAGYPLTEAIRCGSAVGVDFFGLTGLGALTVGGAATMLVVRGSVAQLPRKLAYLERIYVAGQPCDLSRLAR